MKAAFILIIATGILFNLIVISTDGSAPPGGLVVFLLGPYLLLLITAGKSLEAKAYKAKVALAAIYLLLTLLAFSYTLNVSYDKSGVGITALPVFVVSIIQYVISVIYVIVYFIQRRKIKK